MEAAALMDAHVQLKRIYNALNEALDLTRQLADAVDRDDQISTHMLISMRQEPTDRLAQAYQALDQQRQARRRGPPRRHLEGRGGGDAGGSPAGEPGRREPEGPAAACGPGPGGQPQAGKREVHLQISETAKAGGPAGLAGLPPLRA